MTDPLQDLSSRLCDELLPRIPEILRKRTDQDGRVALDERFFEDVADDANARLERLLPSGGYETKVWFEAEPNRLFYDRHLVIEVIRVKTSDSQIVVTKETNRFRIMDFMRRVFGAPPPLGQTISS